MSENPTRQRVIRAVRLLPGTVRVTQGRMEDVPPSAVSEIALPKESEAEKSALAAAEEEVRRLRVELRGREADLAEAREECRNLRGRMESDRAELDRERDDFRAASAKEAAALKEASRIEGYEEGHSKGYPEGLAKADADMKEEYEGKFSRALALLDGMAQSLADARERLAMSHASQLIRLWETMLRKMLATVVAIDPQVVERVVGILLKRLSDRERIIVCLNPDDVAMIEESKEKLMDSIRGVKFFELISDDHVDKGSCLIETNLGIYDARWRTQLEQVSSEVENLLTESMATTDGPGPSEPAQH